MPARLVAMITADAACGADEDSAEIEQIGEDRTHLGELNSSDVGWVSGRTFRDAGRADHGAEMHLGDGRSIERNVDERHLGRHRLRGIAGDRDDVHGSRSATQHVVSGDDDSGPDEPRFTSGRYAEVDTYEVTRSHRCRSPFVLPYRAIADPRRRSDQPMRRRSVVASPLGRGVAVPRPA